MNERIQELELMCLKLQTERDTVVELFKQVIKEGILNAIEVSTIENKQKKNNCEAISQGE